MLALCFFTLLAATFVHCRSVKVNIYGVNLVAGAQVIAPTGDTFIELTFPLNEDGKVVNGKFQPAWKVKGESDTETRPECEVFGIVPDGIDQVFSLYPDTPDYLNPCYEHNGVRVACENPRATCQGKVTGPVGQ